MANGTNPNGGHAAATQGQKKQTKPMAHGGTKGQSTHQANNKKY